MMKLMVLGRGVLPFLLSLLALSSLTTAAAPPDLAVEVTSRPRPNPAFPGESVNASFRVHLHDPVTRVEVPPGTAAVHWEKVHVKRITTSGGEEQSQQVEPTAWTLSPDDEIATDMSISLSQAGTYEARVRVTVSNADWTPGSVSQIKDVRFDVTTLRIVSIKWVSDHASLRNNEATFATPGDRYQKPEWVLDEVSEPISHTWDAKPAVELKIEVYPEDGPQQQVTVEFGTNSLFQADASIKGGINTVSLAAGEWKFAKKIYRANLSGEWAIRSGDLTVLQQFVKMKDVLVTADAPVPAVDSSSKRLGWCVDATRDSDTTQEIADGVHTKLAGAVTFLPPPPIDWSKLTSEWKLLDGSPWFGQCTEQADLMVRAIKLLGSSAERKKILATTALPLSDQVEQSETPIFGGGHRNVFLFFLDSNDLTNRWEAYVEAGGAVYTVVPHKKAATATQLYHWLETTGWKQGWFTTKDDKPDGAIEMRQGHMGFEPFAH
jgi:hypothetical protein